MIGVTVGPSWRTHIDNSIGMLQSLGHPVLVDTGMIHVGITDNNIVLRDPNPRTLEIMKGAIIRLKGSLMAETIGTPPHTEANNTSPQTDTLMDEKRHHTIGIDVGMIEVID